MRLHKCGCSKSAAGQESANINATQDPRFLRGLVSALIPERRVFLQPSNTANKRHRTQASSCVHAGQSTPSKTLCCQTRSRTRPQFEWHTLESIGRLINHVYGHDAMLDNACMRLMAYHVAVRLELIQEVHKPHSFLLCILCIIAACGLLQQISLH